MKNLVFKRIAAYGMVMLMALSLAVFSPVTVRANDIRVIVDGVPVEDSSNEQTERIELFELPLIHDTRLAQALGGIASRHISRANAYRMGVSIGIIKNGEVLYINHGRTNRGGEKITEHTLYELGSITKVFTGILLADLANKGDVSINDTLDKYFEMASSNVRLINLATHTSGYPRSVEREYVEEAMSEFLKSNPLSNRPGTVYEYSNFGMGVLGRVIELVTGKTYNQVVQETITHQIGMYNTTTILSSRHETLTHATPHDKTGAEGNFMFYLRAIQATGGLKSTAYDMSRFIAANLGSITINEGLSDAFSFAMKSHWRKGQNHLGLAWNISKKFGFTMFEHGGGSNEGHTSFLIICPQRNAGVIVLANYLSDEASDLVHGIGNDVMKALVEHRLNINTTQIGSRLAMQPGDSGFITELKEMEEIEQSIKRNL